MTASRTPAEQPAGTNNDAPVLTDEQYAALLFAALCELQDTLTSTERDLAAANDELRAYRRANVWAEPIEALAAIGAGQ